MTKTYTLFLLRVLTTVYVLLLHIYIHANKKRNSPFLIQRLSPDYMYSSEFNILWSSIILEHCSFFNQIINSQNSDFSIYSLKKENNYETSVKDYKPWIKAIPYLISFINVGLRRKSSYIVYKLEITCPSLNICLDQDKYTCGFIWSYLYTCCGKQCWGL